MNMKRILWIGILIFISLKSFAEIETLKLDTEDGLESYTRGVSSQVDDALARKTMLVHFKSVHYAGTLTHEKYDKSRGALVYRTEADQYWYREHLVKALPALEKILAIPSDKQFPIHPNFWALELGEKIHRYYGFKGAFPGYNFDIANDSGAQKKREALHNLLERAPVLEELQITTPAGTTSSLKDFIMRRKTLEPGAYKIRF